MSNILKFLYAIMMKKQYFVSYQINKCLNPFQKYEL